MRQAAAFEAVRTSWAPDPTVPFTTSSTPKVYTTASERTVVAEVDVVVSRRLSTVPTKAASARASSSSSPVPAHVGARKQYVGSFPGP